MCKSFLLLFSLFFSVFTVLAQPDSPLLLNRISHNQAKIAFAAAGKIWLVDRAGGVAQRLTNTPYEEAEPIFSPDGKQIAFSRHNGTNFNIFVTSADGSGEAKRLTMMPENDYATTWTPDGKNVVFATTRNESAIYRLYKMAVEGGVMADSLPLPQAFNGTFSPDGKQIAYNPRTVEIIQEWRYYRGGATSPIWITDLQTGKTEKITNQNVNDKYPMWVGDKIYFISDRTGTFNLFVYDRKTKQTKQLTRFIGQGIRHASATNEAISFTQNGQIHLFDLATNQDKIIPVTFSAETSELTSKNVNAMQSLENVLPSANGEKLAISGRGESIIFDVASGEYKNLTNSSNAAERYSALSPDNKNVAYFSDESGEYQLHIRSLENNAVKKITIEAKPTFYRSLAWSPDSKKLVFCDRHLNLWLANTETGTTAKIDTSNDSDQDIWRFDFSPDSRFLTYAKRLKNRAGTVFIYDSLQKKSFQITDGITHTESPIFDKNGKYLYFISSPNALTSEFGWGVLNGVFARPLVFRQVQSFALTKETPSLILPNRQPNPLAKMVETVSNIKIDFENPDQRFTALPLPTRDYSQLAAGRSGKIFLAFSVPGESTEAINLSRSTTIAQFDLAKLGEMQKIVENIDSYEITQDGSKLLYIKGRDWFLVNAETAPKSDEGKLNLSNITVKANPAEEWRQIFNESVRIMRDWFYDPNHHGQDLNALKTHYAKYLPNITRRRDLNVLIVRMLGSVSVSHLGVGGGDITPFTRSDVNIGLLGADYAIENGRFRFKKILRSGSYASANGVFQAPLDQAGIDVREGHYLLEVNEKKVETTKNIFSYFENTAGRATKITVSQNADGSNPRTFTVYPINTERRLRTANRAENNRRLVEKISGGKLGYIFIEDFGSNGITNAIRGLSGYADKQGIIIDQRFNGGGITPDFFIEWLQRKSLYHYMFRAGDDIPTPVNPAPPVKVLIINEWNGSAAETGAFMFKLGKVGTIVGKRTAGAGVGSYFFSPRFIDNGRIQLPNRAAYMSDGSSWGIENIGVEPDFDVEIMPQDLMAGNDSQLQKAIEIAMKQIAQNPQFKPKRPAFPVHPK